MGKEYEIVVPDENIEIIESSGTRDFLSHIRPSWKAKDLINRVERLLKVDPSSACQRIFNASIHDLREKIIIAGLDIAKEAAELNKLSPIKGEDDILEKYSVSNIIDLAYYMGLLTRPEWRRLTRVYEIRRDLEHEDDEYEAGIEDCVYIFKTCIDVVLSRDPVQIIKLTEIKDIIEQPNAITIDQTVLDDYEHAPKKRQEEIYNFLISTSLNDNHPDIVRQNSFTALKILNEYTHKDVVLSCSAKFNERIGRNPITLKHMRVAYVAGIMPYLKNSQKRDFFIAYYNKMQEVGYHWKANTSHGKLLRDFIEIGAFDYVPETEMKKILSWMILCYIGEPGEYGYYGRGRKVFYSNSGAPLIEEIFKGLNGRISQKDIIDIKNDSKIITASCNNKYIERRFEDLIDILA